MPRILSDRAIQAVMAQHTNEAFILLIQFYHAPTAEYYRAALNTEIVVSQGNAYSPTYFEINLPQIANQSPQGTSITVDNVDQRLVGLLRKQTEPLQVELRLVLASTPDVIEMEFLDLVLREADWDVSKVTGTLASEDPLNQQFPAAKYEPRTFQGLF